MSIVIVLEELNFIFREKELTQITTMNNVGYSIFDISVEMKRDEYEIMLALMHQHKEKQLTKAINFRRN